MKKADRFKPEHKKRLLSNIPSLTTYLEKKTSYKILIDVVMDKDFGWTYSISISIDSDFSRIAKWVIYSTGKTNIKNELLANIAHFDLRNKKLGGTTRKTNKRVDSTKLVIDCHKCGNDVGVLAVHRNMFSPLFSDREGYAFICNSCAHQYALKIAQDKDYKAGILYLCAIFDRPYISSLANETIENNVESLDKIFGSYFSRLNLHKDVRGKRCTFSNSDIQL